MNTRPCGNDRGDAAYDPRVYQEALDCGEQALISANEAVKSVRAPYNTFLLLLTYMGVIVGSTTDAMLFRGSAITLPLLNVELPVAGMFFLMPWLIVALHLNLLLQLRSMGEKVRLLAAASARLRDEDATFLRRRLSGFSSGRLILGAYDDWIVGVLHFGISRLTLIIAPIGILLWMQWVFLSYGDGTISFFQSIAVLADVMILLVLRARIFNAAHGPIWLGSRDSRRAPINWREVLPLNTNTAWLIIRSHFFFLVIVWTLSVQISSFRSWQEALGTNEDLWWVDGKRSAEILLRGEENDSDKFMGKENYADKVREFEYVGVVSPIPETFLGRLYRPHLQLSGEVFTKNELSAETISRVRDRNELDKALKEVIGLTVTTNPDPWKECPKPPERNLRYADLSHAVMPNVGLDCAQLELANLSKAELQGGRLERARLNGASLLYVGLEKADLRLAELQGADLRWARLQGANLEDADLRGADLTGAELQGANLSGAKLHGATLAQARLQGADLRQAQLQAASLHQIDCRMCDMREANLSGAVLWRADLRGAVLCDTWLGGSQMQEVQLDGATLKSLYVAAADMRGMELGVTGETGWTEVKKEFGAMSWFTERTEARRKCATRNGGGGSSTVVSEFLIGSNDVCIVDSEHKERFPTCVTRERETKHLDARADYLARLACSDRWAGEALYRQACEEATSWIHSRPRFAQAILHQECSDSVALSPAGRGRLEKAIKESGKPEGGGRSQEAGGRRQESVYAEGSFEALRCPVI